jgi:hypothetical protein
VIILDVKDIRKIHTCTPQSRVSGVLVVISSSQKVDCVKTWIVSNSIQEQCEMRLFERYINQTLNSVNT